MAYLAEQRPHLETKDSASCSAYSLLAEQNQAVEKAVRLVAVTSPTCPPCKRLKKETLPPLAEEGYDVRSVNFRLWNGPAVDRVPTLFYFDSDNNIIQTEIGFKTVEQVKEKLRKP